MKNMCFSHCIFFIYIYLIFFLHVQDDQVNSDISSALAEASILPYDLIIVEENRDGDSHCVEFSSSGMNADWCARRWWHENSCSTHVSCKPSSTHSMHINGNYEMKSSRIPCILSLGSTSFHGFLVPRNLFCENNKRTVISVAGQSAKKLMLEFLADAYNNYQVRCYFSLDY